ncbi:BppU family phage baseplate upper protein [Lactobacillus johnsonii]|uniref:BppU family phage baseplate upper protein n=1 Tax=Lactobacillus johnsonii TaxID=33959 RepID=UPI003D0539A0
MTQPTLQLNTNKNLASVKTITIRDSGNKEILEAYFLNHEGQPYNLENKTVTFMENKDGDKFVSDPNVQIVNATAGFVRYTLQSQVHSAPGIAWFEINDNSGLVDSTGNFNIRVENGLRATADNTTYIAALEKLKQQMEALIGQADGELKTELQRVEQQLNQELQNFRNQYNSLSNDFQNQFKSAQNARQADYNKQKDAINADWFNTKNNINKNAQDTINAIKSNAKQVLDKDQADWNAKQNQWDSTFSAIVKEWQVKTNSLNSTVQDLTTKFGNIINELTDLMNNKLPDMNAKTDAVNKKIDQLKASLSDVDWTEYAHRSDNSGGVNLLANTENFSGFVSYKVTDGANNGFTFDKKEEYSNDENYSMIRTKVAHVYGSNMKNVPLNFGQNVTLPAGTYTLSFLARHNGKRDRVRNLDLYSDWTDDHGGQSHGESDDIHGIWEKHHITFTTSQNYTYSSLRLQCFTDDEIPGGSLYFANLKLEAGTIATDWCQSYLDFDRLSGGIASLDSPEFNNINNTGIYLITNPQKGNNYPGNGNWGILKVSNAHGDRIEQEYYEDVANGSIYHRQAVSGTWRAWQKLANIDDLSKVKIKLQSLDQNGDTFTNTQTANKQSDGSYVINTYDNDWTANKVSWLLKNTNSYVIGSNTNLNDIKAPGLYHCSGATNISNTPPGTDSYFELYVNSGNWNGSQTFYETNHNNIYIRTWNSSGFSAWRKLVNDNDYSNLQNLINSQKLKVVRSYDIERDQASNPTTEAIGGQWVVDQSALANFADAHRDVRNHTDFRYPTDQALNTAINLNSDPYLDTGIYKIGNCAIINGPWADVDTRRWLFLQVAKYDDNSIFQTINYNNGELYSRCVSKTTNSYPSWTQFATMDQVAQNVSSVSGNLQAFITDQVKINKRVDYESPSGTITNDTVNFNNYRETGILKVINCLIQNGPYKSENRHTLFLKITNLDGQTQYQTVYEGDNLYGRKLYNGSGQWHKYTNTPI